MAVITFEKLTENNFDEHSLDEFVRHQIAKDVWIHADGKWQIEAIDPAITWDWDIAKRRRMANIIWTGLKNGGFGYGAFQDGKIIGYIYLGGELWGSEKQYARLKLFHITAPHRGKGLGKNLFRLGCEEARQRGAKKLYISANHSVESQAAYRRLGCIYAQEVDPVCVEQEPFDVQMEFIL